MEGAPVVVVSMLLKSNGASGINFVDTVLLSDPEDRFTASIAREHMWFELNEEELNELHRAVVVKGSVLTPYRRWAKRKRGLELGSTAKIPSRGNGEGSGDDERGDALDAELEGDSEEIAVESESRGDQSHLTPSKKRRLVPNRSQPDDTTTGKNAAVAAKTRNDLATPFSPKNRGPARDRELISPSPPPIINATPKTADAANALIDFASTGSLGNRDLAQPYESTDSAEAGVFQSGVPESIASWSA